MANERETNQSSSATTKPSIPPSEFTRAGHTKDDIETIRKRVVAESAVLLDVREKSEWDDGHLKHAKLVPLSAVRANELTGEMKKSLPKDKPIYVHCAAGGRVLTVSKILRQQGYDIRPLKLGYRSLLNKGFEKWAPADKSAKLKRRNGNSDGCDPFSAAGGSPDEGD